MDQLLEDSVHHVPLEPIKILLDKRLVSSVLLVTVVLLILQVPRCVPLDRTVLHRQLSVQAVLLDPIKIRRDKHLVNNVRLVTVVLVLVQQVKRYVPLDRIVLPLRLSVRHVMLDLIKIRLDNHLAFLALQVTLVQQEAPLLLLVLLVFSVAKDLQLALPVLLKPMLMLWTQVRVLYVLLVELVIQDQHN